MKVALCISGYMRGLSICLPTWEKHLLHGGHQFDAFVCVGPTNDGDNNRRIDEEIKALERTFPVLKTLLVDSIGHAPPILYSRNFNNRNVTGVLSMFSKIKIANELKTLYEKSNGFTYDVVMRLRPDTFLESQVVLEYNNSFYIPKHGDFGGLNDQMAWSNSENMNYYSSMYDNIVPYMEQYPNLRFDPELFVKLHLDTKFPVIERPDILYRLARSAFHLLPDNETRARIHEEIMRQRARPKLPPAPPPPAVPQVIVPRPINHVPPPYARAKSLNDKFNRIVPSTTFPSPIYKKIK